MQSSLFVWAKPNQTSKAQRGAVSGLHLVLPAPELGAQTPEETLGGPSASPGQRQRGTGRRAGGLEKDALAAGQRWNSPPTREMRRWLGAAGPRPPPPSPVRPAGTPQRRRCRCGPPCPGATPPPVGPSSVVGGHPDNIETFPNELCIETFSFAASLLMHINEWYARPHLIH